MVSYLITAIVGNLDSPVTMAESPYKRLDAAEEVMLYKWAFRRLILPFFCIFVICVVTWQSFPLPSMASTFIQGRFAEVPCNQLPPGQRLRSLRATNFSELKELNNAATTIIVVTPTYARTERIADMTRFSQTLMLVDDIFWIVIEDGKTLSKPVKRMLDRTRIPYVYLKTTTAPGMPKRGWTHRNLGLSYIREHYVDYDRNAVLYFADDDNSYDFRLFDKYIRQVKRIGVWAVGLVGGSRVEAPHVVNGKVTAWDAVYNPKRRFAVDMAGFAVNLDLILSTNATFGKQCIGKDPENCFLSQFNVKTEDAEPFGWDDDPREILVWHTKTAKMSGKGGIHGYTNFEGFVDDQPNPTTTSRQSSRKGQTAPGHR